MAAATEVEKGGAPAWLFSFVDLAFLMLIAMTLLAHENAGAPDLGEIVVPRIGEQASLDLAAGLGQVWQLRVHPPREDGLEPPFELILTGGNAVPAPSERLERAALDERLATLRADSSGKPLLAPHEDSRSQDLLDAAGLIEDYWPTRRRAVIARVFE